MYLMQFYGTINNDVLWDVVVPHTCRWQCGTHTFSGGLGKASLYVTMFGLSTLAPLSSSSSTTSLCPCSLAP